MSTAAPCSFFISAFPWGKVAKPKVLTDEGEISFPKGFFSRKIFFENITAVSDVVDNVA